MTCCVQHSLLLACYLLTHRPDKSVTWTNVSSKDAKICATPNTFSPSSACGPRVRTGCSTWTFPFLGPMSPEANLRLTEAVTYVEEQDHVTSRGTVEGLQRVQTLLTWVTELLELSQNWKKEKKERKTEKSSKSNRSNFKCLPKIFARSRSAITLRRMGDGRNLQIHTSIFIPSQSISQSHVHV